MEKLLRYETCNLWIDCMLMEHGNMFGMKNVICVIMFNQGKTWKKDEICYLWSNCMIKAYLTDCCVAGYPCTAEWGVRPLHCIHCSSNYSHPAGGTPCLCHPVSVLFVSIYSLTPWAEHSFNSNSCFVLRLIWVSILIKDPFCS